MRGIYIVSVCILLLSAAATADVPPYINYQGQLLDSLGAPVPDGDYELTFTIFDDPIGGSALWSSGPQLVSVSNGLFSYALGWNVPLNFEIFYYGSHVYLGITLGNGEEMFPRTRFMTTTHAFYAKQADQAIIAGSVYPDAVESAGIVNGTIQFEDIGQNGAANGNVMKWNGSAWVAAEDERGGSTAAGWTDDGNHVHLSTDADSVGIGTDVPQGKLHVVDGNADFRLGDGGKGATFSYVNGSFGYLGQPDTAVFGSDENGVGVCGITGSGRGISAQALNSGEAVFATNNSGTIASLASGEYGVYGFSPDGFAGYFSGMLYTDGYMGIGTTTPNSLLHLHDAAPIITFNTTSWNMGLRFQHNGLNQWELMWNANEGNFGWYNYYLGADAMTMEDATGNIGIGTASPLARLHVHQGSVHTSNTTRNLTWKTGENFQMGHWDGTTFTERLRITTDGKVGIGTSNVSEKLHVAGNLRLEGEGAFLRFVNAGVMKWSWLYKSWAGSTFQLWNETAQRAAMAFEEGGHVGINTTDPDAMLDVNGDLKVSGAYRGNIGPNNGAPFPRPAYDSDWQPISPGHYLTLTHDIGGDVANYVIDLQFKDADDVVPYIHTAGYGGWYYGEAASSPHRGCFWTGLTSTNIKVFRKHDDGVCDQVRLRIWVYN